MKNYLTSLILLMLCIGSTIGQDTEAPEVETETSITELSVEHCVFLNTEEKMCYVDLERVPMIIRQAVIVDADGNEVMNESLIENSVDSIVELNYSNLPPGAYTLELYSFQNKLVKELQL